MTWAQRKYQWRIAIAKWALQTTGCVVAKEQQLRDLEDTAVHLIDYVEKSGGLREPRRIRAYHEVRRRSERIGALIRIALAA